WVGDGCPKRIDSSHRRGLRDREIAPELTRPERVSIVPQRVRLSAGAFCASGRKWQRNIANIPAGDTQIKSRERRKSIRQSTKDKSKGKFHDVKGNIKEKVGRAANKPNPEVKGQH